LVRYRAALKGDRFEKNQDSEIYQRNNAALEGELLTEPKLTLGGTLHRKLRGIM
jgi:hypothetical protein